MIHSINYTNIIRKTDRLIIRPMREEDFLIIKDSLNEKGMQRNKYDEEELEFAYNYTETLFRKHFESPKDYAHNDKAYVFRVFKKSDGKYIGGIIVKTILRNNFQWGEIGYWLLNQHWGNGFGSEMTRAGMYKKRIYL